MAGLYLNSYALALSGDVRLFVMEAAGKTYKRHELRELAGVSVWLDDDDAYAYQHPLGEMAEAKEVSRPLTPVDFRTLWAAREALLARCVDLGVEARIGYGGEIQVAGLIPADEVDKFRVDHVISFRVAVEDFVDADAVLTAKHRARWTYAGTLADPVAAGWALGRRAVRVTGAGPAQGRVLEVSADKVILVLGEDRCEVDASDYTMTVSSAIVSAWRGAQVLQRLRITSKDLTATGKRNRHAVQDRFKFVGQGVRKLGDTIPVAGGGEISIDSHPVEVRLEDTP